MDKRFSNIFPGLSEARAIEILKTPLEQLEDKSERYIAASHLVNFPTERTINALIEVVKEQSDVLEDRITRRKAIETLGRLKVERALEVIRCCLSHTDNYLVENAVWAIGEIGSQDQEILEEIAQLLDKPGQSYRTIIQVLAKLKYTTALERMTRFTQADDPTIASAAMTTVYQFSGDRKMLDQLVQFLQNPNVNARRGVIQDLMDAGHYAAIPQIARCPVSVVFRSRGIRYLADASVSCGHLKFEEIEKSADLIILDHPHDLELVHEYDQTPKLERAISDLYHTDFGICYLATQTIIDHYPDAGEALVATYKEAAHNDYGAHYHVIKLWGWLNYPAAYELIVEALHNLRPQFLKSRTAAAIALGNLGDQRAIPELKACLKLPIWELKYACLLALDCLGDKSGRVLCANDADWLVQAKATSKRGVGSGE